MNRDKITKILHDLEAGYDLVSEKFSSTRSFFWRDLEFIKNHVKEGDRILDFGCGNGRLLAFFSDKSVDYRGVDTSGKLIEIAKEKYPDKANNFLKIGSQDSLPFPNDFFNEIFSIAVFHHFPPEHSVGVAKELYRTLKPGGEIVITAWNLWQRKRLMYIVKSLLRFDFKNVYIPFKDNSGNVFSRYHHAYTKSDLKEIFEKAGFQVEKVEVMRGRNIVLVGKK
jgi:ubiquinone/menaquinone biosynthesis C-methylase UbiE